MIFQKVLVELIQLKVLEPYKGNFISTPHSTFYLSYLPYNRYLGVSVLYKNNTEKTRRSIWPFQQV